MVTINTDYSLLDFDDFQTQCLLEIEETIRNTPVPNHATAKRVNDLAIRWNCSLVSLPQNSNKTTLDLFTTQRKGFTHDILKSNQCDTNFIEEECLSPEPLNLLIQEVKQLVSDIFSKSKSNGDVYTFALNFHIAFTSSEDKDRFLEIDYPKTLWLKKSFKYHNADAEVLSAYKSHEPHKITKLDSEKSYFITYSLD